MPIYTKNGDKGYTSTIKRKKITKSDPVVELLGTLDELSSIFGVCILNAPTPLQRQLQIIQNDLFDLGSLIAGYSKQKFHVPYFVKRVRAFEDEIDLMEKQTKQLQGFILPGGTKISTYLHWARTVSRRLERNAVTVLSKQKDLKDLLLYFNRLSDYLFVLARYHNQRGEEDILWKKLTN
jgi:cob(I)alamin adenosyltransferase